MIASKNIKIEKIFQAGEGYVGGDSANLILEDGTTFGVTAKVVSNLPPVGENGILYLILKETTAEGNIYDEYMWVVKEDGTFGYERVGATDVQVTLYAGEGQNEDGAMTQKATTNLVGGLANLDTENKTSVVAAINELAQDINGVEQTLHEINNGTES